MKILYFTDPHLSGKGPSSRKDIYYQTTFKKMIEIGDIAKREKADVIICGGDLFHSPVVSLNYAGHIARILKDWSKPVIVVPGNHDIYGYNATTINQTMLGMLAQTGIIRLLMEESPLRIQIGTKSMAIEGREYSATLDTDPANYQPIIQNVDFNIVVNHGMLLDKEYIPGIHFTMTKDIEFPADITVGGHYHYGFKEHEVNGGMFFNPGSLLRTEASTGNKTFVPKVLLFDLQDKNNKVEYTYKYIPLTTTQDSANIFDFSSMQEKKDATALLDQFKQFVTNTSSITQSSSLETMIQDVSTDNNIESEVTAEALDRVQQAHVTDSDSLQAKGFVERKGKLFVTKLVVENFQSHANTVVDFSDGFNVIVGETNSGKTSLLRALQWVMYNDPKGSDFIRTGADECSVTVHLSDGHIINRTRSRSSAGQYKVTNPAGVEEVYQGFGTEIPIEIFNAHQMPLVELSKGNSLSLNISSQLEGPFLLSMNPSEKANAIGRIIGSQVLDGSIKEVSKDVGNLTKEMSNLKKQLDIKNKAMESYDYLPDYKKRIEEAEFLIKGAEDLRNERDGLLQLAVRYGSSSSTIDYLTKALGQFSGLEAVEKALPKVIAAESYLHEISALNESLLKENKKIGSYRKSLSELTDIHTAEFMMSLISKEASKIEELNTLVLQYNQIKAKEDTLHQKLKAIPKVKESDVKKAKAILDEGVALAKLKEELNGVLMRETFLSSQVESATQKVLFQENHLVEEQKKFKEFLSYNKVCPLCETPYSEHAISHIIGEI